MVDNESMSVGTRTARARKLAGLRQWQLAERANVSLSLLRKVERGDRPASPAFTAAVARALGVSVANLYGQPREAADRAEAAVHAAIPELRRVLIAFDDNDLPEVPPTLEELTATLARIWQMHRRGLLGKGLTALPDLLRGLHYVAGTTPPGERYERVMTTLAETYEEASWSAYQFGYGDLAGLAAERGRWAATQSGDPLRPVVAENNRAFVLLYVGAYTAGLRVIDRAYRDTEALPSDPSTLAVRGALHMRGSILAARAADTQMAEAHLTGAREIAEQLGEGARFNDYGTLFRPWNVDIHSVSVPIELADGTTAVSRATRLHLPPGVAPSRLGRHHIDVSRAWLLHGNRNRAFAELQLARRTAPELTRYHPQVRETLQALARAERRRSDTLAEFAPLGRRPSVEHHQHATYRNQILRLTHTGRSDDGIQSVNRQDPDLRQWCRRPRPELGFLIVTVVGNWFNCCLGWVVSGCGRDGRAGWDAAAVDAAPGGV